MTWFEAYGLTFPKNTKNKKIKTTKTLSDTELQQKKERVNGTLNKIKIFFGVGEKLTPEEERRINDFEIKKRLQQMRKQHQSDSSIFTDDSW